MTMSEAKMNIAVSDFEKTGSDTAISVKNLSKTYKVYAKPRDRALELFSFNRSVRHKEFKALEDVSFEGKQRKVKEVRINAAYVQKKLGDI